MYIRPLRANPHKRPGSWGKTECADALLQIASTVDALAKQLDQLWNLANPDLRAAFDAALCSSFDLIDTSLAHKIEGHAVSLEAAAEREAADVA